MPCQLPLEQIVDIIAATPFNISDDVLAKWSTGITTDTRSLKPGEIFIALRGENFNGHEFAVSAVEKGAIATVTDHKLDDPVPQLLVKDTLEAYQQIASWWRKQFDIPIIAVTGSVGKTTTKELIAAVLSTTGNVLKTQLNYNNEIGVPKTLLELSADHDYAVIEMAMRGAGQIALLAQIASPTIGVITNVGTAHIGLLGSKEAIARAKCELLEEMPTSSVAILNHDNPLLIATASTVWQGQTLTYGLEGGELRGELPNSSTLSIAGMELPLPLAGRHNASNFLAALAVAKVLGIDWQPLATNLSVSLPAGRATVHSLPNDIILLDETYNAGTESMLAALQLLAETPGKRRIAVLGAMKELGDASEELHQQVGKEAEQLQLDVLLVLVNDPEAQAIATGASGISPECFSTHEALLARLQEILQPGDRVLFKASHSVALDQVVKQLCAAG
jgi:UDP-N-acetylmuramoyl-tripeptide--D-alanyl-D-alanine ligase